MGYPLTGGEGKVVSWGASGFYSDLISKVSPADVTWDVSAPEVDVTGMGVTTAAHLPALGQWTATIRARGFATPRLSNVGLVSFSSGGYALHCRSFELVIETVAVHDITAFNGASPPQWRSFRPDIVRWSGSFVCAADSATAAVAPHLATATGTATSLPTITLKYGEDTADDQLSGTVLIRQLGGSQRVGSLTEYTYSFVGTGALTPAGTNSIFGSSAFGVPPWSEMGATTNTLLTVEQLAGGPRWSGDAFYRRIRLACEVGSPVELDIDVQGTGAWTPAAS